MAISFQQTPDRQFNQFQTQLKSELSSLLNNPIAKSLILNNVTLTAGQVNSVNHTLNRNLTGWAVVRLRGNATIWDSQDSNTTPSTTLALNTTATVSVDLWVF